MRPSRMRGTPGEAGGSSAEGARTGQCKDSGAARSFRPGRKGLPAVQAGWAPAHPSGAREAAQRGAKRLAKKFKGMVNSDKAAHPTWHDAHRNGGFAVSTVARHQAA